MQPVFPALDSASHYPTIASFASAVTSVRDLLLLPPDTPCPPEAVTPGLHPYATVPVLFVRVT